MVIGGGTGVFTVLSGLRAHAVELTAVVSMADDGGSTGVLREEFGILPPGDVRRALIALSSADKKMLAQLFSHRFANGTGINGHSFGNLMLTALEQITGSFERAVDEAARLLGAHGTVLPVTLDNVRLHAKLKDGTHLVGETSIDIAPVSRAPIAKTWLEPAATLNPRVARALATADLIVLGPGDLFTSLIPNLLVDGMQQNLQAARAPLVYIANLMTKQGETDHFAVSDFVAVVERHLGSRHIDLIVANAHVPETSRLQRYEREDAIPVAVDLKDKRVITADLLRPEGYVRHDPATLARLLVALAEKASMGPFTSRAPASTMAQHS